jgi:SAM-dependent methyltransferase
MCSLPNHRQTSFRRKPWHIDYHHQRELAKAISAASEFIYGSVLDLGSGNQPYRRLFPDITQYTALDINPHSMNVNLVGNGVALPFQDAVFDSVFSAQTLEYVNNPQQMIAEIARVLRPNGHVLLSMPQSWRLHEEPYDFFRYTRYGLIHMLEQHGFEPLQIRSQGGVWMTIGQQINNTIHKRKREWPVYIRYLCYLASNTIVGELERIWYDPDDTSNYVVIAQRIGA